MPVYTNTNFTGFWGGYPTAAVVVADSQEDACRFLNDSLRKNGLNGDARVEDMTELPLELGKVRILNDAP